MEEVGGPELTQLLQRAPGGRLPLHTTRLVFRDLLAGLRHAHSRGFVHCDLKPANVRLSARLDRAVLTDWGLARSVGARPEECCVGTPAYAPPERLTGYCRDSVDGRRALGPASDVWSLGVLLCEGVRRALPPVTGASSPAGACAGTRWPAVRSPSPPPRSTSSSLRPPPDGTRRSPTEWRGRLSRSSTARSASRPTTASPARSCGLCRGRRATRAMPVGRRGRGRRHSCAASATRRACRCSPTPRRPNAAGAAAPVRADCSACGRLAPGCSVRQGGQARCAQARCASRRSASMLRSASSRCGARSGRAS
mmetsp:Transcript_6294/g.18620  ORF Transcript_6294/g.18620 Transcript_6294/m.18620 type:complete len:310 (+) Transcript_6294:459-1388(+)